MDALASERIHNLLDDVLLVENDTFNRFSLWRTSDGLVKLTLKIGDVTYEEERPWSEVSEAITRAKEATDD